MTGRATQHETHVDQWIEQTTVGLGAAELTRHFQRAVLVLWQRANSTLSEITMTAVFHRALLSRSERFAFLSRVKIDKEGVHFEAADVGEADADETVEGYRSLLTEVLTIVGNLTDEVLTPGLHRALSQVSQAAPSVTRELRNRGKL